MRTAGCGSPLALRQWEAHRDRLVLPALQEQPVQPDQQDRSAQLARLVPLVASVLRDRQAPLARPALRAQQVRQGLQVQRVLQDR